MKRFGGIVMRDGSRPNDDRVESLVSALTSGRGGATILRDRSAALVQFGPEDVPSGADDAGPGALVGDLRIDNRGDLVRTHGLRADVPDAELVRQVLLRRGEEGIAVMMGAFAFASWDASSNRLLCGRDHFGVRPLFYVDAPRFFAFGSTLPALLGFIDTSERDETRIAQYLELCPPDEGRTFYRDIRRLPRGHTLTLTPSGCTLRRYWSPDELGGEYATGVAEEVVGRLRAAFVEAVRCRVDGRFDVASFLSGGLDSSSVTCTARSLISAEKTLYTYSAVFPGLEQPYRDLADESRYIRAITSRTGYSSAELRADRLSPLDGLAELLEIHGQPFDPPNAYLDYAMYRMVSRGPARVVLDGLEGDVTLSQGVHFLDELAASAQWRRFFEVARGMAARLSADPQDVFRRYGMPHLLAGPLGAFAAQAPSLMLSGGPRTAVRVAVRRFRGEDRPQQAARIISDRLVRAVDWEEPAQESLVRSEQEAHLTYLNGAYVPSLLEFTHANADHFGLEARHPMFDLRLVREAVRLRPEMKLHDGFSRYAFRRAMQGLVPDEVLWRPQKATLAPNFDLKMANQEKESVDRLLTATPEMREYVDFEALQAIGGRNGHRRRWPAVVLALYLKKS